MARIRSIKPEFWSDAKIAHLSHGCMAFFIGLWNFCDDEGKFHLSARQLSLRMPVFRSKDILTWFRTLSESGLIQVSECSQWGLVTNWNHQRINRPIPTKVKREEIQWLPVGHSLPKQDSSLLKQRKDRIGSDRIVESSEVRTSSPPKKRKQIAVASDAVPDDLNWKIWSRYANAYQDRYKIEPVRNAKVNAQIRQLGLRLGREAPDVIEFYVSHNKTFYVGKMHEVGLCLADAESLRTQWLKGRAITNLDLRRFEKSQADADLDRMIDEGQI